MTDKQPRAVILVSGGLDSATTLAMAQADGYDCLLIEYVDAPLIEPGRKVRLQFEGWPAVQFVGWPSVAVGTFGGKVNRVFPTDDGKGNNKGDQNFYIGR